MLTVFALAAAIVGQDTDTTFTVSPDARLHITVMRGEVTVRTWERSEIRILADHSRSAGLAVSSSNAGVRIRMRDGTGGMSDVDMELTIPATMPLMIDGTFVEADIRGASSDVSVETVQGDVHLTGGNGRVSLHSIQGDVECEGSQGRIDVSSSNGDVTVIDARGEIVTETVNGEIDLENVRSSNVEATTVNGDVTYEGTIEGSGRYGFTTHNGDITLAIPSDISATVSVSTFSGDFESDFPITLMSSTDSGKRFEFTLGGGRAQIALSSFGGTISLERP